METVRLRAVLSRCVRAHGLGEPVAGVEEATLRASGVYGATPTCYLSMAARVTGFAIRALDDALYERRTLVRIPAMRHSGYMMTVGLVPHGLALAASTGGGRWLLPALQRGGLTEASIGTFVVAIEALLRGGPRTAADIRKGLKGWREPFPGALGLLLRSMSHSGRIVATRVRGGWRSQLYEYALLRDWVAAPQTLPTLVAALRKLAPLYFDANGPATLADFAWWAGVPETTAKEALAKLELESVLIDKLKGIHLATRESLDDLASEPEAGSLALLPVWDAYLMAHAERRRYLDPKWRDRVVDRSGNVTNVVLRDGRVVGLWDVHDDTLRFAPFEPIKVRELHGAVERLRGVFEIRNLVEARVPGPLSDRGQNAFMAPLR